MIEIVAGLGKTPQIDQAKVLGSVLVLRSLLNRYNTDPAELRAHAPDDSQTILHGYLGYTASAGDDSLRSVYDVYPMARYIEELYVLNSISTEQLGGYERT